MKYVTDLNEIFRLLRQSCGDPVYQDIGKDEEGYNVAVPVFTISDQQRRTGEIETVQEVMDSKQRQHIPEVVTHNRQEKSVVEAADAAEINPRYAIRVSQMNEIREKSRDSFEVILRSYCFGYIQGMKACREELGQEMGVDYAE